VELWNCPAVTDLGIAALGSSPKLRLLAVEGLPSVTRAALAALPKRIEVRLSAG
jgi:hypothetical protein